jgi:hemolysin activation/secretion protein
LPEAAPRVALPQLLEPQLQLDAKQKILVRTIAVEGDQPLGDAETRAIVAPYEGRQLSMADIYELADKLTNFYRAKGFLVAKTYVPAQDARSGHLRLKLLVGRLGAVTVRNNSLVNDDMVKGTIDRAFAGQTFIEKDAIERAMLLVADLAGATTPKATIGAGAAPGSSDFNFEAPADRRVTGYAMVDNWGAPSTGRVRASSAFTINSPLGIGDRIDLYGLMANNEGLLNGRAAYSLPVFTTGARAEIAVFRTTYVLGESYAALEANGVAQGVSGTVTYPLQRQQDSSLYLSVNGAWKQLWDIALATTTANRDIVLGTLALTRETSGDFFGHALVTSGTLSATVGDVTYPNPALATAAAGDYVRGNVVLTGTLGLIDKLSFTLTGKGQTSFGHTLDTSEQFSVTGAWAVRSFNEGLSGDSGVLATPELRYQLPDIYGVKHSVGAFYDYGAGWLAHADATGLLPRGIQLQDVGGGYAASWEWSERRAFFFKAQVAHTVGSPGAAAKYNRETAGLFQLGTTF